MPNCQTLSVLPYHDTNDQHHFDHFSVISLQSNCVCVCVCAGVLHFISFSYFPCFVNFLYTPPSPPPLVCSGLFSLCRRKIQNFRLFFLFRGRGCLSLMSCKPLSHFLRLTTEIRAFSFFFFAGFVFLCGPSHHHVLTLCHAAMTMGVVKR